MKIILKVPNMKYIFFYLWGFTFLIFFPTIPLGSIEIRAVDIITLILLIHCFFKSSKKSKEYNKKFIMFLIFIIISYLWSILGLFNVKSRGYDISITSIINPIRRIVILLMIIIFYIKTSRNEWNIILKKIYKGFLHSCILTSIWMIMEQIFYYKNNINMNNIIFNNFLKLNYTRKLELVTSQFTGGNVDLNRAIGLSTSPGIVSPAVLVCWLMYLFLPNKFTERKKISVCILLLLVPFISLSRTTIFGFFLSLIIFFILFLIILRLQRGSDRFTNLKNNKCKEVLFTTRIFKLIIFSCLIVFIINIFDPNIFKTNIMHSIKLYIINTGSSSRDGDQRHLIYLLLVPKILYNFKNFIFGFGPANVGVGYEQFSSLQLPGIEKIAATFNGNWSPESNLVNQLLMGGIFSGIIWIIFYITYLKNSYYKILEHNIFSSYGFMYMGSFLIMIIIIILSIGYGIDSTWYYYSIVLLCYIVTSKSQKIF